jgi:hypothetical protein
MKKSANILAAGLTDTLLGDEDRFSRGENNQKARNLTEEKAAWKRRVNHWKKKNAEGAVDALKAVHPLVLADLKADDTGLRFLKFKAIRAIGQENIDAILLAAIG